MPDDAPLSDEPIAVGYAAAQRELEDLLADLEDDALDIDLLAAKVARASELIRFCRARISAARIQVDRIVADLEQLPDGAAETASAEVDPDLDDLDDA
jgi:exodeoxyribonuclease VII small subunit